MKKAFSIFDLLTVILIGTTVVVLRSKRYPKPKLCPICPSVSKEIDINREFQGFDNTGTGY